MDIYCPIQGMGEQPLPLGKDFSLIILSGLRHKVAKALQAQRRGNIPKKLCAYVTLCLWPSSYRL